MTNSLFEPPFGGLRVTYELHLWLVRKLDFLFAIIALFSLDLTVETL